MYYITSHCACCVVRSQTERSLSYNAFKLSAKKSLKVSQPHNEINGRVGGIGSMHNSSVNEAALGAAAALQTQSHME